ncbi:MAG: hypothetical protein RL131_905, partial [Bacteroidota bacterium]
LSCELWVVGCELDCSLFPCLVHRPLSLVPCPSSLIFAPMTISYNWLMEYFSEPIPHDKLSLILNSIGLEVESYEHYQEIKGGLAGLVVGEVLTAEKHPNADRLSITTVNTGGNTPLQIVCGAPNVAAGQKVIVAQVGVTIFPTAGEPITMKAAKIRGVESQGMICAEDEIGLGTDHNGIKILPAATPVGIAVASLFEPYEDYVISIGLTPNRSDAMSHFGVARDICAWINHHEGKQIEPVIKQKINWTDKGKACPIEVIVENQNDCPRYCGIWIEHVKVGPSPNWMQQRLKAIGQRPINNIVDATNYILHDLGQPLHAFDAEKIKGQKVRIKNLPKGTSFIGLDEKERKLDETDLMICDADSNPMCMGGVFGGIGSGVSDTTQSIFLESAWFHPIGIRKSSYKHLLRTEAAMHFEKSVDIGETFEVLKKAALLIAEVSEGKINTDPVDQYPSKKEKIKIELSFEYVRKLSGKEYEKKTVSKILSSLGFIITQELETAITVEVPTHKTDVHIPADLVEEIMRIDGFDNIQIPTSIQITPSVSARGKDAYLREKLSQTLVGAGFNETLNNSITHSKFYSEKELSEAVRLLNNLSAELDTLRYSMLETGLQTVAHNLNHRNSDLKLFEFGKIYKKTGSGYKEEDRLALFTTGKDNPISWNKPQDDANLFHLKGVLQFLAKHAGVEGLQLRAMDSSKYSYALEIYANDILVGEIGKPSDAILKEFDIKVPVWFLDIRWNAWLERAAANSIKYKEIAKYPVVERDLSFVLDESIRYGEIEKLLTSMSIPQLKDYRLFDIFKSDKLGKGKQSMAMNFSFQDEDKTMKDQEIDSIMQKISKGLEKQLNAELRK